MTLNKKRLAYPAAFLILAAALLVTMLVSFQLGRYPVPLKESAGILLANIKFFGFQLFPIEPFWTGQMEAALINIRLPRILMAGMVGCSLSAAGAAYQGVFQNPMASPDVLGATQGACFGAALAILFGASRYMTIVSAFLVSSFTIWLVFFIGSRAQGKKLLGLILSGIMVSHLFNSATSYIKLVADPSNQLPEITYWLMGSLSGATMRDIHFVFWPMLAGLVPLMLLRWRLNVLTLGDEEAKTMGLSPSRLRVLVLFFATLVTAASISVSGQIGWVGLIIPHLTRRIVGSNFRQLMPASMLMGAIYLIVVDNFSRNLLAVEIPIGILTAFVGAPFFIYLITRRGDER